MMIFKFCVGAGWFSLPAAFQYSGVLISEARIYSKRDWLICGHVALDKRNVSVDK
jgi:hypothetical protein